MSLEEALHREEAREELGIEVRALRWLGQIYEPVEPAAPRKSSGLCNRAFQVLLVPKGNLIRTDAARLKSAAI